MRAAFARVLTNVYSFHSLIQRCSRIVADASLQLQKTRFIFFLISFSAKFIWCNCNALISCSFLVNTDVSTFFLEAFIVCWRIKGARKMNAYKLKLVGDFRLSHQFFLQGAVSFNKFSWYAGEWPRWMRTVSCDTGCHCSMSAGWKFKQLPSCFRHIWIPDT